MPLCVSTPKDNCAKGRNNSLFSNGICLGSKSGSISSIWPRVAIYCSCLAQLSFRIQNKHTILLHTLIILMMMSCGGTTELFEFPANDGLSKHLKSIFHTGLLSCLLSNTDLMQTHRHSRGTGQMAAWGDTKRPRRARWRQGEMQRCVAAAQWQRSREAELPLPAATNPLSIRLGPSTDKSLIRSKPGARRLQEAAVFCRWWQMRWFVNVAASGYK